MNLLSLSTPFFGTNYQPKKWSQGIKTQHHLSVLFCYRFFWVFFDFKFLLCWVLYKYILAGSPPSKELTA